MANNAIDAFREYEKDYADILTNEEVTSGRIKELDTIKYKLYDNHIVFYINGFMFPIQVDQRFFMSEES